MAGPTIYPMVPTGHSVRVIKVDDNVTDLNAEIAAQNGDGYSFTDMKHHTGHWYAIFIKTDFSQYAGQIDQKLNEIASHDQTDIDNDIAAELANGYICTGVFADGSVLYLAYSLLTTPTPP